MYSLNKNHGFMRMTQKYMTVFLFTAFLGSLPMGGASYAKNDLLSKADIEEFYNNFAHAKKNGGEEYIRFQTEHFDNSVIEVKRIRNNFPGSEEEEGGSDDAGDYSVMERNKDEMLKTSLALSKMNKYSQINNEMTDISYEPKTGNVSVTIKTTAKFEMHRYGFGDPFHVDEVMICNDVLARQNNVIMILQTDCTVDFNIDRRI